MDCNLGSEIGQKMRSAVKAKLLELGTGGSAGFIDDELPDYVMVMVANKRTKQQMNAELNLFLGDQTDLFVTWLHEVLQKLQEVTLPASTAVSKKRKSRQGETPKTKEKDKKSKDKRDKSKDKGIRHRKSGDELPENATKLTDHTLPAISSITDVFAEELLEKAKKTLDVDSSLKDELLKKKKRKAEEPSAEKASQDFDIPTMSEISSTTTTTSGNREKDMAELAEIQRKIYAAKQHLRQIGELGEESDEDEIENDIQEPPVTEKSFESPVEQAEVSTESNLNSKKAKSPIVFNRTSEPTVSNEKAKAKPKSKPEVLERRSVHERLGCKPPTPIETPETPKERPQRVQKEVELYVPAHRRIRDEIKKPERGRERGQSSRRRERIRHSANISPAASRSPSSSPDGNYKHRIGSRVIVAVNKQPEPSDDEDILEKPVNSVIKIKPRPVVSPRRQACKNLLLRAVADAQRSTILAKTVTTPPVARPMSDEPEIISTMLGKRPSTEVASKELFRRSKRDLVVNVLHRDAKRIRPTIQKKQDMDLRKLEDDNEDEYVPSVNVGEYETYVPQLVPREDLDIDIDMHVEKSTSNLTSAVSSKTQFVVTLNGDKSVVNPVPYRSGRRLHKRTPSPQVSSTSSSTVQQVNMEPTSTTGGTTSSPNNNDSKRNKSKRGRSSSHSSPSTSSNTPPPKSSSSLIRPTQEIKKIIIKNDADDDEGDEPKLQRRTSRKRRSSSTTTVTLTATSTSISTSFTNEVKNGSKGKLEEMHRSTTPPLPPKHREKREEKSSSTGSPSTEASLATASLDAPSKVKHTPIRFKLKHEESEDMQLLKKRRSLSQDRESSTEPRRISIRNADDRKYENLPALSAVSVDSTVLKVSKPKERCKYHPNCTKQFCEYYHPSAPCKSFPNCKFADKCMYSHPKCKFDSACMSIDCNFAHSGARDLSHVQLVAPPLSSHVIPVQNYKSISAQATGTTATTMCKYYPNCTKAGCTFYHPKPCRYGKNCVNKIECIFYHPEMQSKFKWVASLG